MHGPVVNEGLPGHKYMFALDKIKPFSNFVKFYVTESIVDREKICFKIHSFKFIQLMSENSKFLTKIPLNKAHI